MAKLSTRGLTARYMLALGLVIFLTITSHFVVKDMLRVSKGSAEIINMSGRQRMLSQRIASLALELDRGDVTAQAPLKDAITQFDAAHRKLLGLTDGQLRNPTAEARLRDAYFGVAGIDETMRAFIAAASRIADHPEAADKQQRAADLALLETSARGPLLDGLEQVVTIHQALSEERTQHLEWLQRVIVTIVVITVQLEALFIFRPMVSRISSYVRQLLELADRDYLTGVANRRAFTDLARTEIQRARRYKRKLSLLLIDADHFKRVNDMHGHLSGDAVLASLANTLEGGARREDVVGRIGGEEFAVLLPETSLREAQEVAERLRRSVANHPIEAQGKLLEVTISIGMANVPLEAADPLEAALGTADSMLYKAKEAGRNCVWPKLTTVEAGSVRPLHG